MRATKHEIQIMSSFLIGIKQQEAGRMIYLLRLIRLVSKQYCSIKFHDHTLSDFHLS